MKPNYKKMYLHIFNSVTDALRLMPENISEAAEILKQAQSFCEEMYVESEDES